MRAFADHCTDTYEFLVANGVQFKRFPDNVGAHSTTIRHRVKIMRSD